MMAPKVADITGLRFSKLTVLARAPNAPGRADVYWRCLCDCGAETVVRGTRLKTGCTKSCGCIGNADRTRHFVKHGESRSGAYKSWHAMIARCTNPGAISYPNYGGRGIAVCSRWMKFEVFLADMGHRPEGASIDRIDNDGNYEPGNCRWAGQAQQHRNRRVTRWIACMGETLTLIEWSEKTGIGQSTIRERLRRGWTAEGALGFSTPL